MTRCAAPAQAFIGRRRPTFIRCARPGRFHPHTSEGDQLARWLARPRLLRRFHRVRCGRRCERSTAPRVVKFACKVLLHPRPVRARWHGPRHAGRRTRLGARVAVGQLLRCAGDHRVRPDRRSGLRAATAGVGPAPNARSHRHRRVRAPGHALHEEGEAGAAAYADRRHRDRP